MGYGPTDMVREWQHAEGGWFDFDVSAENPWDPYDEAEEDDSKTPQQWLEDEHLKDDLKFDPDKIAAEIKAFHQKCKDSGLKSLPYNYDVHSSGFWHCETMAIYFFYEGGVYYTPDEWLAANLKKQKEEK